VGAGQPFLPASDDVVLLRLGPEDHAALREARGLRARLLESPGDPVRAAAVARRLVELSRQTGDPRLQGWARAALSPWRDDPEAPVEVLVLRATLAQARHEFELALEDLGRVLERRPRHPQALLTAATVELARGRPDRAARACAGLLGVASPLVVAACAADAAGRSGRAAEGLGSLSAVLDAAPEADAATRAWARGIQAELAARLGRDAEADGHLATARALAPGDAFLRTLHVDHLLDTGRHEAALDELGEGTDSDGLLLRRALAARQLERPEAPALAAELARRLEAARLRGSSLHLREEAWYLLELADRPAEALARAREGFAIQREPRDAWLVLRAAAAAGRPEAAAPALEWRAATGLEDVRLDAAAAALGVGEGGR
jgi:hypothetical protein